MSIAALNWAWSQPCDNPTAKLVLLALADKANDDGECWPTMDHVADLAGVSPRQVSNHLNRLERDGLLSRTRQRRQDGTLGRYVYQLLVHRKPVTSGSQLPAETERHNHRKPASGHKATHNSATTTLAPDKPARDRDHIFEALIQACGLDIDELTSSARGAANKAAKELREVGASPDGIHARAKVYRQKWADRELTPSALARHYAQLGAKAKGPPKAGSPVFGSDDWEARQREQAELEDRLLGDSA